MTNKSTKRLTNNQSKRQAKTKSIAKVLTTKSTTQLKAMMFKYMEP